jgi:uncharacterized protein YqeY
MPETPKTRVGNDVRAALKAGDKERLSTLRMLLAEIGNEEIRSGREVEDAALPAIVRRAVKQRREAAEQFRRGDRAELAAKEEREAAILEEYLPKPASEDQIRAAIRELVAAQGLSGPAAIGAVMKGVLGRFGGAADGATVNRLAREILSGG